MKPSQRNFFQFLPVSPAKNNLYLINLRSPRKRYQAHRDRRSHVPLTWWESPARKCIWCRRRRCAPAPCTWRRRPRTVSRWSCCSWPRAASATTNSTSWETWLGNCSATSACEREFNWRLREETVATCDIHASENLTNTHGYGRLLKFAGFNLPLLLT